MLAILDLKSRLLACAQLWARANAKDGVDAPLSRLGKAVAFDANFFDRIAKGGGLNLATLEKFAAHLILPSSWPDDSVPQEARDLAHVLGVSLTEAAPSRCNGDKDTPERDAA